MALPLHQRTKLLKNWDLSCPDCGSINNVKVAGAYDFYNSPHRWFCHCGVCGKTFNPRQKGGDDVASIRETARKTLPKELLGKLLAAGKTNKEIGEENGNLPHWAVSDLKKQYWPDGFNPDEYKNHTEDESESTPEDINQETSKKSNEIGQNINELITLREAYAEEIACIDRIQAMCKKLTPAVIEFLTRHRAENQEKYDQIDKVFTETVLKI